MPLWNYALGRTKPKRLKGCCDIFILHKQAIFVYVICCCISMKIKAHFLSSNIQEQPYFVLVYVLIKKILQFWKMRRIWKDFLRSWCVNSRCFDTLIGSRCSKSTTKITPASVQVHNRTKSGKKHVRSILNGENISY